MGLNKEVSYIVFFIYVIKSHVSVYGLEKMDIYSPIVEHRKTTVSDENLTKCISKSLKRINYSACSLDLSDEAKS